MDDKFPVYVPEPIREYVRRLDPRNDRWGILHRLIRDPRMKEAYGFLHRLSLSEDQWTAYLYCAWNAVADFDECRAELKGAQKINEEIAEAASKLAGLLREMEKTRASASLFEYSSLLELLWICPDSPDNYDPWWREILPVNKSVKIVLAEHLSSKEIGARINAALDNEIDAESDAGGCDDSENVRLMESWLSMPTIPEILDTLATVAKVEEANEYGMAGAAISFRQKNKVREYLRALQYRNRSHPPAIARVGWVERSETHHP